jgi:hypothetical protein
MRVGWLFLLIFVFFSGCGYKPTYIYTKKVLGDDIYVDVDISLTDPQNSVLITDAINEAVISKFRSNLTRDKKSASSQLYLSLGSVSFKPIQYDENGYVIAYKTYVTLSSRYIDKYKKTKSISTSGNYDFNIEANSVISDNKRFEAIKFAALKAIDELISKISIKGRSDDYK